MHIETRVPLWADFSAKHQTIEWGKLKTQVSPVGANIIVKAGLLVGENQGSKIRL